MGFSMDELNLEIRRQARREKCKATAKATPSFFAQPVEHNFILMGDTVGDKVFKPNEKGQSICVQFQVPTGTVSFSMNGADARALLIDTIHALALSGDTIGIALALIVQSFTSKMAEDMMGSELGEAVKKLKDGNLPDATCCPEIAPAMIEFVQGNGHALVPHMEHIKACPRCKKVYAEAVELAEGK